MVFNALTRRRNQVAEAWGDIETHLKRRYDLIPNLVETVKGYSTRTPSIMNKQETFVFNNLPKSAGELKAMPEAALHGVQHHSAPEGPKR